MLNQLLHLIFAFIFLVICITCVTFAKIQDNNWFTPDNCPDAWISASSDPNETFKNLTNLSALRGCLRIQIKNNIQQRKKANVVNERLEGSRLILQKKEEPSGIFNIVRLPLIKEGSDDAGNIEYFLNKYGRVQHARCYHYQNCVRTGPENPSAVTGTTNRHKTSPPDIIPSTYLKLLGHTLKASMLRETEPDYYDNAGHIMGQQFFTDQRKYTIDWDPLNFVSQPAAINGQQILEEKTMTPETTKVIDRVYDAKSLRPSAFNYGQMEQFAADLVNTYNGCQVSLDIYFHYNSSITVPNVQYNTRDSSRNNWPPQFYNYYYPIGFSYKVSSSPSKTTQDPTLLPPPAKKRKLTLGESTLAERVKACEISRTESHMYKDVLPDWQDLAWS
jgi:hypothetical protein